MSEQTKAFEAAGELLKVLAAPARLAIVMELAERPLVVHELVGRLGISQPLVSQHLRVLRGARLVGVERHGREATYSLADQHVARIVADAIRHGEKDHGQRRTRPAPPRSRPGSRAGLQLRGPHASR